MAQVQVVMTGEEAKLWRAQQRIINQQKRMETGYQRVQKAGRRASDQTTRSTRRQTSAVGSLLNQYVSLGGVLNIASAAMQNFRTESDRALGSMRSLVEQRRRLAQVSLSAQDLNRMEQRADELAVRYGVDRSVVRDVMFSARSEGFEAAVPRMLAGSRVVDPASQARAAGQIPTLFKGQIDSLESINATLTAAQRSRLDFASIVRELPKVAEGAGIAGAEPSEAFGLLSVLASEFATGSTAADRIKGLGVRLGISEEFGGRGILGGVEALAAATEEERKKFLGDSQELNVAFRKITENLPEIRQRISEIDRAIADTGTRRSPMSRAISSALDPSTEAGQTRRALMLQEQARIQREIANERELGIRGADRRAALDRSMARLKDRGVTSFSEFYAERFGELAQGIGLPGEFAGRGAEVVGLATSGPFAPLRNAGAIMEAAFGRQDRAAEGLQGAADSLNNAANRIERATGNQRATPAIRSRALQGGGGVEF